MTVDTISEPQFMLTELRYTLGQLHVQVLDLDPETRSKALCEGRSIDGWQLTTQNGETWTLFEVDGTLIAAQTNDAVQSAVLASLRRLRS